MPNLTKAEFLDRIVAVMARRLKVDARSIDTREPFSRYRLESIDAVELLAELETVAGRRLAATLAWSHPSPESLARFLAGEREPASAPAQPIASPDDGEPIAIIGMACRFPKAPDLRAYWRMLSAGMDAVTEIPPDRWNGQELFDPDRAVKGKMNTHWGAFLDRVDEFDPLFFGISPTETIHMYSQQRLMLE